MKLIAAIAILFASAIIIAACKLTKEVDDLTNDSAAKWKGPMPSTHFNDVSREDE